MHTSLLRRFYADPEFYRGELEHFYFSRWICAGRADQIPKAGGYFSRTLGDESVIVTRDASGSIHALFNVCRHRARGCANRPKDISSIAFSARITRGPTTSKGACSPRRTCRLVVCKGEYPLHRAGCDIWDGHIFVHLGQEGREARETRKGTHCAINSPICPTDSQRGRWAICASAGASSTT